MCLDELIAAILAKPGPLRLVAVDGPGGAGKSTFARGDAAHYQRCDWPSEMLAEWHTIEPAPIVIIEGRVGGSLRVGGTSQLSHLDRDPS